MGIQRYRYHQSVVSQCCALEKWVCSNWLKILLNCWKNIDENSNRFSIDFFTIKWYCYGFLSILCTQSDIKDKIFCTVTKKWIKFCKMTFNILVMFPILIIMSSVCVSVLSVQQWAEQPSSVFVNPGGEVTLACRILNKKVNNIDILFVLLYPGSSQIFS